MSSLICWQWSEAHGPTLGWAGQLAVCACALCAFRECSPPLPLQLAGFVPSGALGLQLGLFPLLGWFLLECLGARSGAKRAWPSAPQAPLASPQHRLSPHYSVMLGCCPGSVGLPDITRCGQGDDVFEMKSLLSCGTSLLTAEGDDTAYVIWFVLNDYSQVRWISTSAGLVHDWFQGAVVPWADGDMWTAIPALFPCFVCL